jgi:hypothetical protein
MANGVSTAVEVCDFGGCGRPASRLGLCQQHYRQHRRGETLKPLRVRRRYDGPDVTTCTFEDCERPVHAMGLCHGHYMQFYRGETKLAPLKAVSPSYAADAVCAHGDCNKSVYCRGLCRSHYSQLTYHEHKQRYLAKAATRTWERRQAVDSDKLHRGCLICGYRDRATALTHHHLDPAVKRFAIGQKIMHVSLEEILEEIQKCVVLCRNCHAILHEDIGNVAQTEAEIRRRYGK